MLKKAILLSIPFLVVTVGFTLWFFSSAVWRDTANRLDADLAKARTLGLPIEASQIAPPRSVPDEDNAAMTILAAETEQTLSGPSDKVLNEVETETLYPDANPAKLSALLKPADKVIDLLRKLNGQTAADFHREWDLGPLILFPDLAQSKKLVKIVVAHAEIASMKKDWKTCIADLELARKISIAQGSEPTLISLLVGLGEEQIALKGAERSLDRMAEIPEAVEHLRQFAAAPSPLPNLRHALMGEVYFEVTTIRNLDLFGGERALEAQMQSWEGGGGNPEPFVPTKQTLIRSGMPSDTKKRAYLARVLEFWNHVLDTPFANDPLELGKAIDKEMEKVSSSNDPTQRLMKVLVPVFGQSGQSLVRIEAQRRVLAALCSVVSFKQRTGHFPPTLADAGVTTKDPFGNGPLRMVLNGKGVRVYSVGADGVDNHGMSRSEMSSGGQDPSQADVIDAYPSLVTRPPARKKFTRENKPLLRPSVARIPIN